MGKKANRIARKFVGGALAVMMLFASVSCKKSSSSSDGLQDIQLSDFEVWGAPATEKVLQE